jgi:hypothetical protein
VIVAVASIGVKVAVGVSVGKGVGDGVGVGNGVGMTVKAGDGAMTMAATFSVDHIVTTTSPILTPMIKPTTTAPAMLFHQR